MKSKIYTGACKYCGQVKSFALDVEEDPTEEQLDEAVTQNCDCEASMTNRVVNELFSNKPEIIPLIVVASEKVIEEAVEQVTIKVDSNTKAVVKLDLKTGRVKVRRIRTLTDEA